MTTHSPIVLVSFWSKRGTYVLTLKIVLILILIHNRSSKVVEVVNLAHHTSLHDETQV